MPLDKVQAINLASDTFNEIFHKIARVAQMPDGYARSMKINADQDGLTVNIDYKTDDGKPLDIFLDEGTKGHFIKPREEDGVLNFGEYFSKGHFVSGIKGKFVLQKTLKEFEIAYPRKLREMNR